MKAEKASSSTSDEKDFVENFRKDIIAENAFLTKLLDSIPPAMYFGHDIKAKIAEERHNAMDEAAEDMKRKSPNHRHLLAKGKHKISLLNRKSISQIQQELSKKKRRRKRKDSHSSPVSVTRAANIEELQKKLHSRIEALQTDRKASLTDSKGKRRLKNQLKRLKSKQKGSTLKAKGNSKSEKPAKEKKKDKSVSKPAFNKEGNFIYSKFEFNEDGIAEKRKNEYSGKKPKVILNELEKKKEKLDSIKAADPEKAQILEEKEKWKKAIQKSEGLKVKDDPALLKKSIKKEEKKKKQGAKAWAERIDETERKQKARQDKRTKNIKNRKQEKLERKIKLAKKKGRVIPGF